jgi:lipopolysaccharide transport system ATP-binding protein
MTAPLAISIRDVSVAFKFYDKPIDMLKEALFGRSRHGNFWALRNINLDVHEGERVGIIGHNGAGKSTLLQAVAGRLTPTTGDITVHGKISSLLSLVPAWNLDDTGLENIRFNLTMQGVDPHRIDALVEDIIEFTDLGPFIHQPVKTYSSGMSSRLSFAIATAVDPEILIVDEVLGTGDGYFAGRAARRMQQMCERGKALLFVSHSTAAVRMMCDTCVWIENGEIRLRGPAEMVLRRYEEDIMRQQDDSVREGTRRRLNAQRHLLKEDEIDDSGLLRLRLRADSEEARVVSTHYVRNIRVEIDDTPYEVPLDSHRPPEFGEAGAVLDLEACEWGRLYDRASAQCRMLLPRTGARDGGHLLVRPPAGSADSYRVKVSFEEAVDHGAEQLAVDAADAASAAWRRFDNVSRSPLADGWSSVVQSGEVTLPRSADIDRARQMAASRLTKPAEIESVEMLVEGRPALSVPELAPFDIRVRFRINDAAETINVAVNVVRSDGAYVFYQPSGLDERNISGVTGPAEVTFHFDPNPFGVGSYEINVFLTNAFDWANCPPSDVYDRRLAAVVFNVNLKRPISFGLVNLLVPVSINVGDPKQDQPIAKASEAPDTKTMGTA